MRLAPGDLLVLFTDGVTEGRRGREFFGDERLATAVRRHGSRRDLAALLLAEVLGFQEGSPRDDIAVVAVRVPPEPARPPQTDTPTSPPPGRNRSA